MRDVIGRALQVNLGGNPSELIAYFLAYFGENLMIGERSGGKLLTNLKLFVML